MCARLKIVLFKMFQLAIKPLQGRGLGKIPLCNWIFQRVARQVIPEDAKTIEINGYKMNVRVGKDRAIGGIDELLLFKHEYEPTTSSVFEKYAKGTVIDIGANIGYFTLLAATLTDDVVAIEPEARNVAELEVNVKLNGCNNVSIIHAAASNKSGVAELNVSQTESGEHSLIKPPSRKYQQTQQVKLITIDELKLDNVGLIKVDTEGHEYEVLEGASETIKKCSPVLVIEIWTEGLNASGHKLLDFATLIHSMGYTEIEIIDEYKKKVYPTSWSKIAAHIQKHGFSTNIVCRKGEK